VARKRPRALALWALTSIEPDDELQGIAPGLRAESLAVRSEASSVLQGSASRDIDQEVIATRYALIDAEIPKLYPRIDAHPPKRKASERVDRVLLHPVFGFVIFVALMLVMFQSLFSWSESGNSFDRGGHSGLAGLVEAHYPRLSCVTS